MLENLCGMFYQYRVELVNFVAGSCMQVRFCFYFALALPFLYVNVVSCLFHACVTLAKQVSVLIHAALSKFGSCFWKETLQANLS